MKGENMSIYWKIFVKKNVNSTQVISIFIAQTVEYQKNVLM